MNGLASNGVIDPVIAKGSIIDPLSSGMSLKLPLNGDSGGVCAIVSVGTLNCGVVTEVFELISSIDSAGLTWLKSVPGAKLVDGGSKNPL